MTIKKHKLVLTFNAPVTLGFIFTCLVVLVINQITFGQSNKLLFMTYHSSLTNPLTYVRLFYACSWASGVESFLWKCYIFIAFRTDA